MHVSTSHYARGVIVQESLKRDVCSRNQGRYGNKYHTVALSEKEILCLNICFTLVFGNAFTKLRVPYILLILATVLDYYEYYFPRKCAAFDTFVLKHGT